MLNTLSNFTMMLAGFFQETTEAAEGAAEAAPGVFDFGGGQLMSFFDRGGLMMWPLLAAAILGLAFIIERMWVIQRSKIRTDEFLTKIRAALLKKRSVKEAIAICEQYRGPIAAIMKAGLLKYGASDEEIQKSIEIAATHELARLERGLAVLSSVANVAPMLGFLGTVTGMIAAFDALVELTQPDPRAVARGISEALITTATGLTIAVPAQIGYNYYTEVISRFVLEMETSANLLMETFIEMEHPESGK